MPQLIFIVDPMCSWCWGFHPVIEALRKQYAKQYDFRLVLGGLRTTGQMEWTEQNKAYLLQNWNTVKQKTAQPFSFNFLNKSTFDYDTYPSCKAVITIRELYGEDAAFAYLADIQEAFYGQGKDITSPNVLSTYVTQNKKDFHDFYTSLSAQTLMQKDFLNARSMEVSSFPSTIIINKEGRSVIISGYKDLEELHLIIATS